MRTKKTIAVLISGLAGSGKTTARNMLGIALESRFKELSNFPYSFASPLKYIAKAFLSWDGEKDFKGRKLLQQLGHVGREYNSTIWVRHMFNQAEHRAVYPFNFILIDDWRFPNELETIKNNPAFDTYSVRIIGRNTSIVDEELSKEDSETSLSDDGEYDFVIDNSGDLERLAILVDGLVDLLQLKFILE